MSKKPVQEQEQQVITDPFDYVYTPNTMVYVTGEFLARAIQFFAAMGQEEMKEQIVINKFNLEDGPARDERGIMIQPKEEVIVTTTPRGKAAEALFQDGMEIHIDNIQRGLAVKASEAEAMAKAAQGPKLDLME